MKPIDFHPAAAQDANDAVDYYDGLRSGLGNDLRADLDSALQRIQANPALYAAESGSIRVCPLRRFPYLIYYDELADRIWVAAVGHRSRRPGFWIHRKPS